MDEIMEKFLSAHISFPNFKRRAKHKSGNPNESFIKFQIFEKYKSKDANQRYISRLKHNDHPQKWIIMVITQIREYFEDKLATSVPLVQYQHNTDVIHLLIQSLRDGKLLDRYSGTFNSIAERVSFI